MSSRGPSATVTLRGPAATALSDVSTKALSPFTKPGAPPARQSQVSSPGSETTRKNSFSYWHATQPQDPLVC